MKMLQTVPGLYAVNTFGAESGHGSPGISQDSSAALHRGKGSTHANRCRKQEDQRNGERDNPLARRRIQSDQAQGKLVGRPNDQRGYNSPETDNQFEE